MSRRHRAYWVGDFMSTAVVTMRPTDSVATAAREMRLAAIRHLVVVDGTGRPVGVVSSHDVVAALAKGDDPPLADVMSRHLVTTRPDEPAEHAVGAMIDRKIDCLPVLGEDDALVGIVTATDFLVVAHQALTRTPLERAPGEI